MTSAKISEVDGRIRGRQIDIELNDRPSNKPQELKLHHVTPLGQKLLTWLFVILYLEILLLIVLVQRLTYNYLKQTPHKIGKQIKTNLPRS